MLIEHVALVGGFGLVAYIVGILFDRPDVAAIGAIIIIGIGGSGTLTGIQYHVGETTTTTTDQQSSGLSDISTAELVTSYNYSGNPAGIVFDTAGDTFFIINDNTNTIDAFSTTNYNLSALQFARNYTVTEDDNINDNTFNDDGSQLYVSGSQNNSIYQYTLETPFNLSNVTYTRELEVGSNPQAVRFNDDGTILFVLSGSSVHEYDLTDAYNISSAVAGNEFSFASQDTDPSGLLFNSDGTLMIMLGSQSMYQYSLDPYDISTAAYDDASYDITEGDQPHSSTISNDDQQVFVSEQQTEEIYQYNVSDSETVETTTVVNNYDELQTTSSFPLGPIIMIVGGLMLFHAIGKTDEQRLS